MKKSLTVKEDLENLSLLGKGKTVPGRKLEAFPNHHPDRDYLVTLHTEEFTCVCPLTGQPDFAKIKIQYIPDQLVLESKSLKLYLHSFRNEGTFHEPRGQCHSRRHRRCPGTTLVQDNRRFRRAGRHRHFRGCRIQEMKQDSKFGLIKSAAGCRKPSIQKSAEAEHVLGKRD